MTFDLKITGGLLYDGEGAGARVLGGGFIDRTERAAEAERMLERLETALAEAG